MEGRARALLRLAQKRPLQALLDAWYDVTGGELGAAAFVDATTKIGRRDNLKLLVDAALLALDAEPFGANGKAPLQALLEKLDAQPLALLVALDEYAHAAYPTNRGSRQTLCRLSRRRAGARSALECEYWIAKRARPIDSKIQSDSKPPRLQHWLRHHWIFPRRLRGYSLTTADTWTEADATLRAIGERGEVRVAVASFTDDCAIQWQPVDAADSARRVAAGLVPDGPRHARLIAHLEHARDDRVDVLVLPELTLPRNLREEASRWLSRNPEPWPRCVVAGSFHERLRGDGRARNRAVLFGPRGATWLQHDKLRPVTFLHERFQFLEAIEPGCEVRTLESALGRIALAICLDHSDESADTIALWEWLAPDWLFVPAMERHPELGPFTTASARYQRSHGTCSAVANQPPVMPNVATSGSDSDRKVPALPPVFGLICPNHAGPKDAVALVRVGPSLLTLSEFTTYVVQLKRGSESAEDSPGQ